MASTPTNTTDGKAEVIQEVEHARNPESGPLGDEKGSAVLPDVNAEKRLLRKLDRTILPWIMLMYFLSYMDR